MAISDLATISLTCDKVKYFADGFADFINSRYISTDIYNPQFFVEKLLFSFEKKKKKKPALRQKLLWASNVLLALSLHDEKTIAEKVLGSISMEPAVALAILC